MEDLLLSTGLTRPQAKAYLYLLEKGESSPPALSSSLKITRTNAYKVLESLEQSGLVYKSETNKKLVYRAADPSALASLVAEQRDKVITLEHSIKAAMQELRKSYRSGQAISNVSKEEGSDAMIRAYERQSELKKPIYLIKSRADIPFLGFAQAHRIRYLANRHHTKRYGITPDAPENPVSPEIDKRSNFVRTWIPTESYTAPVEWTVSGDELLMEVFEGNGRVIRIEDAEIAESFRQLWQLIDNQARSLPGYQTYSPSAKRRLPSELD